MNETPLMKAINWGISFVFHLGKKSLHISEIKKWKRVKGLCPLPSFFSLDSVEIESEFIEMTDFEHVKDNHLENTYYILTVYYL